MGGIIFFKAGRTFSPGWCYPPGLKDPPLVPVPDPGMLTPGWGTGTRGGSPPGVKPVSVLVLPHLEAKATTP